MRTKPKSLKKNAKLQLRCGLCGMTKNLTKTECCGNWICDDEHKYMMFSYARNSCYRNHSRYTLCGYHHNEGHTGSWQDCKICRASFETELYVWYGTNEYNYEKLANPPAYEPTRCSSCGGVIKLGTGGYSISGRTYTCEKCYSYAKNLILSPVADGKRGKKFKATLEKVSKVHKKTLKNLAE